jgi:hypothetical protein
MPPPNPNYQSSIFATDSGGMPSEFQTNGINLEINYFDIIL